MPDLTIKELHDSIGARFEEFKTAQNKVDDEVKKFGKATGLAEEKVSKIEIAIKEIETLIKEAKIKDRLDSLELKLSRPPVGPGSEGDTETREHEKKYLGIFRKILRTPPDRIQFDEEERKTIKVMETKAFATDSDAAGGYLVPHNVANRIIEILQVLSPVRALASVESISTGNSLEIPKEAGAFSVTWVGERTPYTETTPNTFAYETIPVHTQYGNPWATQQMLSDSAFDMEGWIGRKMGFKFAQQEGAAFCVGTGFMQPAGVSVDASVVASTITTSAAVDPDKLITLFYSLPVFYRQNSTWLWHSLTTPFIRKLKDTTNQYLWQPGLTEANPPLFLGRTYTECDDIPVWASASATTCFVIGDIRSAYTIVDREGVRVLRNPYRNPPNIEFSMTRRVGGQVILGEALKYGKG